MAMDEDERLRRRIERAVDRLLNVLDRLDAQTEDMEDDGPSGGDINEEAAARLDGQHQPDRDLYRELYRIGP